MSPAVTVTLILVVGIALVLAAAVADRRCAVRAAETEGSDLDAERSGHPAAETRVRSTPPAYVTSDQLLRDAPPAARFTADQERELASQLAASSTVHLDCHLAAPTLATHTGQRSILDQPRVLVCADGIVRVREVLGLLGAASADMQPLVIAAPTIDAEVLETIIANKLAGRLQVCVLLGTGDSLEQLAAAAGSTPMGFADRQSGAIALTELGRPTRVVADATGCWVIAERG